MLLVRIGFPLADAEQYFPINITVVGMDPGWTPVPAPDQILTARGQARGPAPTKQRRMVGGRAGDSGHPRIVAEFPV